MICTRDERNCSHRAPREVFANMRETDKVHMPMPNHISYTFVRSACVGFLGLAEEIYIVDIDTSYSGSFLECLFSR